MLINRIGWEIPINIFVGACPRRLIDRNGRIAFCDNIANIIFGIGGVNICPPADCLLFRIYLTINRDFGDCRINLALIDNGFDIGGSCAINIGTEINDLVV